MTWLVQSEQGNVGVTAEVGMWEMGSGRREVFTGRAGSKVLQLIAL